MNSGCVACGCQLIPLSGSAQRETLVGIMKHSKRNIKNEPITMTNMLTYSDNSLKFQYDFVIHLVIHQILALIGCFLTEQSSCTWWEEFRTNNVKAKTCLFTGQVDPDSRDKILCDKRILAITNLETENKTNKPKKKNLLYNTSWTALTV